MSYLFAFLGFAVLIILHEAGHFVAAKAVGMRVERFSLFFGPMLLKTRRGETEYGVGVIPLGGFVKITGMNPNEDIPAEYVPRAYYNQAPWRRIVTILAGPAVNIVIAFFLIFGLALSQGQTVTTRDGKAIYTVQSTEKGSPASRYLKAGDEIVAVDGRRITAESDITAEVDKHKCFGTQTSGCVATTPVKVTVRRDGQLQTFVISPRYNATIKRPLIGIGIGPKLGPMGAAAAASSSLNTMWYVTHTTVTTVARIFEPKERKQLNSVVGGYAITQQSFATSTSQAVWVLALISLSLGVINLFPFLPLDGGHVFWAVAEKVRGRRIPFRIMERAGVIGFALIILVFVIGLSNDISTLTGPGFHVGR